MKPEQYLSKRQYAELAQRLYEEHYNGGDPIAYIMAIRAEYLKMNPRLFEMWKNEIDRLVLQEYHVLNDLLLVNPNMTLAEAKPTFPRLTALEYLRSLLEAELQKGATPFDNRRDKYGYKIVMDNVLGQSFRRVYYGSSDPLSMETFSVLNWDENKPILEREYLINVPFVDPTDKALTIDVTEICKLYDLQIEQCKEDQRDVKVELEEQKERAIGSKVAEEIGRYSLGLWQYAWKYVNLFDLEDIVQYHLDNLTGEERKRAILNASGFLAYQSDKGVRVTDAKQLISRIEAYKEQETSLPTDSQKKTDLNALTHRERALYYHYRAHTGSYPLLLENESAAFEEIANKHGGTRDSFRNAYRGTSGKTGVKNETDRLNANGNEKRISKILPHLEEYPEALQMAEDELERIRNSNRQ